MYNESWLILGRTEIARRIKVVEEVNEVDRGAVVKTLVNKQKDLVQDSLFDG